MSPKRRLLSAALLMSLSAPVAGLFVALSPVSAQAAGRADDQITAYSADATLTKDGQLQVKETVDPKGVFTANTFAVGYTPGTAPKHLALSAAPPGGVTIASRPEEALASYYMSLGIFARLAAADPGNGAFTDPIGERGTFAPAMADYRAPESWVDLMLDPSPR